jgi:ATP-binding cassette subfamily B (MDR/TAP) protein 1
MRNLSSFLSEVSCWMVTGERQAARIRGLYLKTILRQDVAFFDKETNTGEVVGRMSGDTVLIQDAMGEKVGKFLQLVSTFIGGFIVAFFKGWLLTLVLLTSIPLLVASGGVMSILISKTASHGQGAYANAANVVEQTISSIRTVCHIVRTICMRWEFCILSLGKVCLTLPLFSRKLLISTTWLFSRLHHLPERRKL